MLKLPLAFTNRMKAGIAMNMLFPQKWLNEVAETDPHAEWPGNGNTADNEKKKTNREIQREVRASERGQRAPGGLGRRAGLINLGGA